MHINPKTFDLHFRKSGLRQRELAELARVSTKTLMRIRRGMNQNQSTVERIARALKTTPEVLAGPPKDPALQEAEGSLKAAGYRRLSAFVSGERALQYALVEAKYGVSAGTLIASAPLFFVLLAEMSLAERREKLAAFGDAIASCKQGAPGHLNSVWRGTSALEDAFEEETESLARADIRGTHIDDSELPDDADLFVTFLSSIGSRLGSDVVEYVSGETDFLSYEVLPSFLAQFTANDPRANFALSRGYVRLSQIPPELAGETNLSARVAWLAAKVPDAEWEARQAELAEFDSLLNSIVQSPNRAGHEQA